MKVLLVALSIIYIITPCSSTYLRQAKIRSIQVRIPDFNKEEFIETEEDEFAIKAKEGDCLSYIVEWCLSEYLRIEGHQGTFKFKETLYNIVNSIKTESGKPDLIFRDENISFKLPKVLKVYRFDYYHKRKQIFGLGKLKKLLDFHWLIEYNPNTWNCSESAAFVEYYLENRGRFNTDIVCDESHAWCIVEVQLNLWIDIECAACPPQITRTIRHYEVRYENIREAMDDAPGEFDWWNVVKDGVVIGRKY
jgi:hypothetical protein